MARFLGTIFRQYLRQLTLLIIFIRFEIYRRSNIGHILTCNIRVTENFFKGSNKDGQSLQKTLTDVSEIS